jgi:hypothetical protein
MTRQEWLEKFINLCETSASTNDFRRHCRIKAQHLPRNVRRLAEYRAELTRLQAFAEVNEQVEEAIITLGELPEPPDDLYGDQDEDDVHASPFKYTLGGAMEIDLGDSYGEDTSTSSEEVATEDDSPIVGPSDLQVGRDVEGFENQNDSGEAD